ncbi:MAG TPA: CsgG/HfaB family protein, partial [Burkholderiaceae bacterium]|nr:CsgG/HfaB family protein [Burkholderiaceae bacterium]
MLKNLILSALLLSLLAACDKKEDVKTTAASSVPSASVAPAVPATPAAPHVAPTLDVGKVENVVVQASGSGISPGAAVNEAIKSAIMQVNGTTMVANSANLNVSAQATANIDVETANGTDSAKATGTLQSNTFADQIVSQSKGVVSSFKVLKATPPAQPGGTYTVDIEASVAKFAAPKDSGKIKIVIAPLHSDKATFNIGGRQVRAEDVLNPIRQQIIDSLSQSGRFTVLDRQFEGDIENELDMIDSGKTTNADFAKMGQALSADLVWVGVVNSFAYEKHAHQLQTSDRQLVSYSGGWAVSQRLINLATRQILSSTTLHGDAPSIAPTTLGTNFSESATLKGMGADLAKQATEAIILRNFPISVVQRDGNNVVLSQGGQALAEGQRYHVYLQGKEVKDPQTGQSLGNMETMCCDVVIGRVTPTLSYGTLDNVKAKLDGVQPGELQLREAVLGAQKATNE